MPAERLQKLIARAGLASRRGAEVLIEAGRVRVGGQVAKLGDRADPATQRVTLDGAPLPSEAGRTYVAIHKPRGMLSSARDERGRQSVVSLVAGRIPGHLWPAGRLDLDSEGLMIVTDDGAWAHRLLHPRYGQEREYAVLLDDDPADADIERLLAGVELDDGPARLLAASREAPPPAVAREPEETGAWLRILIGEGRKREVRRLFAVIGRRVLRLARTRIGDLELGGLGPGEWRALDQAEIAALAGRPVAVARRRAGSLTVAIDGTSGSGKSTVGRALARRLGARMVDTGLLYRALTLAALDRGINPEDGDALADLAGRVQIEVRGDAALLDGVDVSEALRTPRVDRGVSSVSRHPAVRSAMLPVQREAARHGPTVMVGRDIGTVVLPRATLKLFLTASAEVRAERRAAQFGREDRLERYQAEIAERDAADIGRAVAPLRRAVDAVVLDTGELDVDACVDVALQRLGRR